MEVTDQKQDVLPTGLLRTQVTVSVDGNPLYGWVRGRCGLFRPSVPEIVDHVFGGYSISDPCNVSERPAKSDLHCAVPPSASSAGYSRVKILTFSSTPTAAASVDSDRRPAEASCGLRNGTLLTARNECGRKLLWQSI